MSYQEKRSLLTIISGIVIVIVYSSYAWNQYQGDTSLLTDATYWSRLILTFIAISAGIIIVLQILFHIFYSISIAIVERESNENVIEKKINAEFKEDERDKIVGLKSMQVGYVVTGVGLIVSLTLLALEYEIGIMLNVLFLSAMLGSILEGFVQIFYYNRA